MISTTKATKNTKAIEILCDLCVLCGSSDVRTWWFTRSLDCGSFQQQRLAALLRGRDEMPIAHDQPGTGIPPKNGIVVVGRTDRLGPLVPDHPRAAPPA